MRGRTLIGVAVVATITASCGRDAERPEPEQPRPTPVETTEELPPDATPSPDDTTLTVDPVRNVERYDCDRGVVATVERFGDSDDLLLILPDVAARMWMVESGRRSSRYETRTMSAAVDGDSLRVRLEDGTTLECRRDRSGSVLEAARLAGAELVAVGDGLSWIAEVRSDAIVFQQREGERVVSLPRADREEQPDGAPPTRFSSAPGEVSLAVEVLGSGCPMAAPPDGFDLGVRVEVDGRSMTGCGTRVDPIVPRPRG